MAMPGPTKTILTTITLHAKDEKRSRAFKYDPQGVQIAGKHVLIDIPPGTVVTLDAKEADKIMARHGGEETDRVAEFVIKPNPDDFEDEEIISLAVAKSSKPSKAGEPA